MYLLINIVLMTVTILCIILRTNAAETSDIVSSNPRQNNWILRSGFLVMLSHISMASMLDFFTFHVSRRILRSWGTLHLRVKTWGVRCEASGNGSLKKHSWFISLSVNLINWVPVSVRSLRFHKKTFSSPEMPSRCEPNLVWKIGAMRPCHIAFSPSGYFKVQKQK